MSKKRDGSNEKPGNCIDNAFEVLVSIALGYCDLALKRVEVIQEA